MENAHEEAGGGPETAQKKEWGQEDEDEEQKEEEGRGRGTSFQLRSEKVSDKVPLLFT